MAPHGDARISPQIIRQNTTTADEVDNLVAAVDRVVSRFCSGDVPVSNLNSGGEAVVLPNTHARRGRITLVGAGTGGIDFLTIAAVRALQAADLVIADLLVPDQVLQLVKGRLMVARKKRRKMNDQSGTFIHGRGSDVVQDEISEWALAALNQDEFVVRLKQGDPFVFGRGGEEILFFEQHGYRPEVIPGVSSALVAPAACSIPVTHRGVSDQLLITTAQGRQGTLPELAPFCDHRTTVWLMCVRQISSLCTRMIEAGYPKDLPAAVVERATCPGERAIYGRLFNIAERVALAKMSPPSVFIVGYAVQVLNDVDVCFENATLKLKADEMDQDENEKNKW